MTSSLAKVAAVVSSIVLVSGFVALRGGGDIFPSSKSGRVAPVADADQQQAVSSSDTGIALTPTTQPQRALMPGSKSFTLVEPPPIGGDAAAPPEKTLMFSSKSGPIVQSKDISSTATTAPRVRGERTLLPGSKTDRIATPGDLQLIAPPPATLPISGNGTPSQKP